MPRRAAWLLGLAVGLAGCGPVKVQRVEREAIDPHADRRVVEFHVGEAWIPSDKPSISNGEAIYAAQCASCHAADGSGLVGTTTTDFTHADWIREERPLDLAMMLWNGHSASGQHASVQQGMSRQQLYDVLAYCRFLSTDIATLRTTERELFGINCNVCHGNHGFGNGFLAPTMQPQPRNLTDFNTWGLQRTDAEIFDNIAHGVHWSAMLPWRGVLEDQEIWLLVDFIRSWQARLPEEGAGDEGSSGESE